MAMFPGGVGLEQDCEFAPLPGQGHRMGSTLVWPI